MKWTWKVPAAALAAVALGAVMAPAAQAAELQCTDDLGDQTISGDLVVPAGATCVLGGATVEGDVIVNADAWLDATSVTIEGDVIATDAYGVLLDGTTVTGDVSSYSAGTRNGFLYLLDLAVGGSVAAGGIDVEVSGTTVAGNLTLDAPNYADLLQVGVKGDVAVDGAAFGASVQGAVVGGSLTVSGSSRDVLVGATADGAADTWGNQVSGDLVLRDNTANLQVAGTKVLGAIALDNNDPAANFGPGVVAGSVSGDHGGETPGTPAAGDQSLAVVVPDRFPGEFTWSLEGTSSLVDLGVAEEAGDHFAADGKLVPVNVTDTRIDAPGWSVSAQVSDFVAGGEPVSSKYLGWTPWVGQNDDGVVAGAPVASGFDEGEGLSVSRTLGTAEAGHDAGSWTLGADLGLKLPVDVPQGTYTATLTLTALS